jgi:hypothetical protein
MYLTGGIILVVIVAIAFYIMGAVAGSRRYGHGFASTRAGVFRLLERWAREAKNRILLTTRSIGEVDSR